MTKRLSYIILLCVLPLMGWGQGFDDMVARMNVKSLPLINLEVEIDSVSHLYFIPGRLTLVEYNNGSAKPQIYNCLVRQRGKTALFLPKWSFAVKLVDDNGEKLDANLLGLREDNSWILDAMGIDKLRMRNRVCFDIWNEYSHTMWDTKFGNRNGTVGTMVEVFVNSEYAGIYCLSDKINRQLLNLRKAKVEDDDSVTIKGVLYKGKGSGLSNTLLDYEEDRTDTIKWNTFELQYPEEYPSLETWKPLMDLIEFNGKTELDYFKANYNEWYYIDNLADYFLLLVALGIDDMPYKNTFLSLPDINFDHRFMLTPWDLDACLGRGCNGTPLYYTSQLTRLNNFGPFNRIIYYNIDDFKDRVARRWDELKDSVFSPDNLENHITAIAQRYVESGAWQREYDLWKDVGEDVEEGEDYDERIIIVENVYEEVDFVMEWYRNNHAYITRQLLRWHNDYEEPDVITSATITQIYNYILGNNPEYDERLDLNGDGTINSADVTFGYNVILGS
ncbi:MAG: CotH kinase family protein [Muribaculaceae bacterium]|nr:CotH kinase family protein [Muribaculaceae bacterium]